MRGNMVAGDDNGEWLSVASAARRLGVSRQAIQNRVKRGKIEHRLDNRGNPIVRVAATRGDPVSGATRATGATGAVADVAGAVAPPEPRQSVAHAPEVVPASVVESLQQAHERALERQEAAHQAVLASVQGQVEQLRADLAEQQAVLPDLLKPTHRQL
jgi:biotin operon repressor